MKSAFVPLCFSAEESWSCTQWSVPLAGKGAITLLQLPSNCLGIFQLPPATVAHQVGCKELVATGTTGARKVLGKRRQEAPRGLSPAWLPLPRTTKPSGLQESSWARLGEEPHWVLWALLVAGAMANMGDEDLAAYFRMQYKVNCMPLIRKLRLTEEDTPSPFLRLQMKRKQVQQMQKDLELKQEEFREQMKVISCRWRNLRAKEAQLKTCMEKSERTLKENDKMRIQALNKAKEEREKKMLKESELLRAKEELEATRNIHQKLCNRVQKYSIFKKYLEDVVKISQFEEIQEVIRHYENLLKVRKDLLQSQHRNKEMSEQAKVLLDQYMEEKEAEILQYQNELVQLQQRFDQAQSDIISWETHWADIQNKAAKKTQELGTIKLAILNLFQCVSTQLKANLNVPVDDSHRQLDMIQQFIQDFTDIAMEGKQKAMHTRQYLRSRKGHTNVTCSDSKGSAEWERK